VYELPPGSLVRDAVQAAGGPGPKADLDRINLAQELVDQQQVYVPYLGDRTAEAVPAPRPSPTAVAALNVNTASAAELEALPNIGPATAQRIVEYRETFGPFEAPEEILEVPGVGPATFAQIQDLITVAP
jgi:competence protein ComEA